MNLKELSDILGISQTTISRALNGYPEVNKDTKKRVEEAALKYGYRPSSVARRLAGKRVEAVGVVYPFDRSLRSSPVFLEMVRTLSMRLREEKIDVFIIPGNAEEEISLYKRMVTGGRVDSFVVVATRRDNDERIKWLIENNIPFLAHGRTNVEGDYSWFDVDNHGGIYKAANKLIELGHRKIALINPSDEFYFAHDRKQGLLQAVKDSNGAMDEPLFWEATLDEETAYSAAVKALSVEPQDRPTAIICSSMLNSKGVLRALDAKGLKVGKDVSVIAWEDGVSDIEVPGMSVISAPVGVSGDGLGGLMLSLLRKDENKIYQQLQEAELILKDSVGACETAFA